MLTLRDAWEWDNRGGLADRTASRRGRDDRHGEEIVLNAAHPRIAGRDRSLARLYGGLMTRRAG